jgi:hypothetical protein
MKNALFLSYGAVRFLFCDELDLADLFFSLVLQAAPTVLVVLVLPAEIFWPSLLFVLLSPWLQL